MSDGRVNIDTRLETGNIRKDVQQVNSELDKIGSNMVTANQAMTRNIRKEYTEMGKSIGHTYRGMSDEARTMHNEMKLGFYQSKLAQAQFKDEMVKTKYGYYQLMQASKDYQGTNAQFMAQVKQMGAEYKAAKDNMINADRMQLMSMMKTAGMMMNMTTQAQRISQNYDRMANPLYRVNNAGLALANTLNQMANNGNASVLALKMLGPTASMKSLLDMQMMINQGLMRFQMVALAAAATSALLYTALFKAAKGPDPSEVYKKQAEALAKYKDAVQQRTQEIVNAWNIFEEVQMKKTSGKQLIKNLEEQVGILGRWKDNLANIAQRAGSEFSNYLAKLGPQSAEEVKAIANMTQPELDKYVSLWREKTRIATEQATTELQKMKAETDKTIKELQDSLTPLGLAWERMKNAAISAIQPMVNVFGMVMTPLVNFAAKVFELVDAFNQAHPVLAMIIQGIIMLVPILTLILSPLAIGIGLWNGMLAAWSSIWMLIGPLVTGLAAMSATVWIVAAAIVGLVAGIVYLWNTNEGFRAAVISAWQAIQTAAVTVWNFILNSVLIPIWTALVSFGQQLFGQLKGFWDQNGQQIMQIAQVIWSFVQQYVVNQITTLVTMATALFQVLKSVIQAVWGNIQGIISAAVGIILNIIAIFVNILTGNWSAAWQNVVSLLKNAWNLLVNASQLGVNLVLGVIRGLGNALGGIFSEIGNGFFDAGKGFMDMLIKGVESMVGSVTKKIGEVAGKIRDFLPFSPAKTGPLSDLDHLDFGGPISDSIKLAFPKVKGLLGNMLTLPDIQPNNTGASQFGNVSTNSVTNNTPISVTLNYSGEASKFDVTAMVDMIETELQKRLNSTLSLSGVKAWG